MMRAGATARLAFALCGIVLPLVSFAASAEPEAEHGGPLSATQIRIIALCPGVAIHGLGHLAAGDTETARWLFIAETAGYAAMFTSASNGRAGIDRSTLRGVAFGAGAALFIGSWIYDVIAAPAAARTRGEVSLQLTIDRSIIGGPAARLGLHAPLPF
jgi:hypothetical protein